MTGAFPSLESVLASVVAIAHALALNTDVAAPLNEILARVRETLHVDWVILYHLLPEGEGVVQAEAVNSPWSSIVEPLSRDLYLDQSWLEGLQQGQFRSIADIDSYVVAIPACQRALLKRYQVRAKVVVPVLTNDLTLWGALIVHQCREPRQWQSLEIQYLQQVAMYVGMALSDCADGDAARVESGPQRALLPGLLPTIVPLAPTTFADAGNAGNRIDPIDQFHYPHFCQSNQANLLPPEEVRAGDRGWEGDPISPTAMSPNSPPAISPPAVSGDAVWDWDLASNMLVMYRRQSSPAGHTDTEIRFTYAEWTQRVHPDDRARVIAAVDHYLHDWHEGTDPFGSEYRFEVEAGSYCWLQMQGEVVERTAVGEPLRMIGTNTDITAQKQTEVALQESQTQLEILFNSLEDFVFVADAQGRILRANRIAQTWLGYTEAELKTLTILDLHPPERRAEVAGIVAEMLAGQRTLCTIPLLARDGTQIAVETRVTLGSWEHRPALFGICRDVSDRVAAEQTLREQEAFLRSIYDGCDVSIFVVDVLPDGHFRYGGLNPTHERLTGIRNQDLQGQTPEAFFPPNVAAALRSHYRSCVLAGQPIVYEEYLPFQGQDTWWLTKLTPLRDATGRIYRLIGTSIDISDRVRIEAALYESQQKYQILFQTLPVGVSITDAQGRLIEVNPASERILGIEAAEHLHRDLDAPNWQIIRPDGSPMPPEEYASVRALRENVPVENVEMGVVQPNGQVRWLNVSAAPIPLDQYGVAITYVDVTDRKRMDQHLRDRDEMLRKLLQQVPGVVYQYRLYPNGHSCFPYASEGIREIYGVTSEQVREDATAVLARLHPDDVKWVVEAIWQSFHNLTLWHDEYRVILPGKGVQWREGHAMPEKLADGSVLWHGYIWDITARKQTEAQVQSEFQRERMLYLIDDHIRASLDLAQILRTTVEEVRQFLDTDRVIIYRFTADWHGVVLAESVAAGWLPILSQEITDSCFVETQGSTYHDNHVNAVNDIYRVGFSECHIEMLERLQVRAKLVVPIVHSGRLWGLLIAHHCQGPRWWEAIEGQLLQQLAGQLAIAIQQAELHQQVNVLNATLDRQVQERTAQLQQALDFEARLKRITDKVRDSLDEHQILQTAVEELAQGLQVEACDTGIYNADHTQSTIAHEVSTRLAPAVGRTFSIANALYPEIYPYLFRGESCQFCGLVPPLRSHGDAAGTWQQHLTILAYPIVDDQGVLGDIWLFKPPTSIFNEQEVRLVQQVANQCAIALRQSRLYQAAQAQVEELERLNRLKDDFLSTVSHELRTPMANIKLATQMLDLLLQQAGMRDDYDRYLSILKSETEREIRLINDLLWLTRLDAETEPLMPTAIDLRYFLPQIAQRFQDRAQQQQQQFHLEIPAAIPPLITDLAYLERSLTELLENAFKHTPAGETIHLGVQTTATTVILQVKNSGVEIPIIEHDRIFNTFYRIPNANPWQHSGTGLGLALVKKLVESLGGTLTLESEQNWTTFSLHLPWSV